MGPDHRAGNQRPCTSAYNGHALIDLPRNNPATPAWSPSRQTSVLWRPPAANVKPRLQASSMRASHASSRERSPPGITRGPVPQAFPDTRTSPSRGPFFGGIARFSLLQTRKHRKRRGNNEYIALQVVVEHRFGPNGKELRGRTIHHHARHARQMCSTSVGTLSIRVSCSPNRAGIA